MSKINFIGLIVALNYVATLVMFFMIAEHNKSCAHERPVVQYQPPVSNQRPKQGVAMTKVIKVESIDFDDATVRLYACFLVDSDLPVFLLVDSSESAVDFWGSGTVTRHSRDIQEAWLRTDIVSIYQICDDVSVRMALRGV